MIDKDVIAYLKSVPKVRKENDTLPFKDLEEVIRHAVLLPEDV